MTRILGYNIKCAPCCGRHFRTSRYLSMNFMAGECWTDGYRDQSLMPSDHGLRECSCGAYYATPEMALLSWVETSDLPDQQHVTPQELPLVLTQARNPYVELAARLDLWHHLNHAYRDQYRAHRVAEDAATKAAWEAGNPDQRTTLQKLFKAERKPRYQPALDRPVTFPVFEPSPEQRENMMALLDLTESVGGRNTLQRVELRRELGQFEAARQLLATTSTSESSSFQKVSASLIERRQAAPARYAL